MQRTLDSAADSVFPPVLEALGVGQFSVPAAGVSRIAPDPDFVTIEEIFDNGGVMNISPSRHDTVDQPVLTVDTDVGLHTKVPLVAFSDLVHIGVAGFVFVIGGARFLHDAGINDGSTRNRQAVFVKIVGDQLKLLVTKLMLLHQIAKLTDGCFIGSRLVAQINANKLAHGAGVVYGLFGGRVRHVKPMLEKVDAQHSL